MIKKQLFPEKFLLNNASSDRSFERAKTLAKDQEAIQGPIGDDVKKMIFYSIHDKKLEQVQLTFHENGLSRSYSCTCKQGDQAGLCSHVIVALLDLNRYESEDIPLTLAESKQQADDQYPNDYNQEAVEDLLENYWKETMIISSSLTKETVNMEFILTMKVGLDFLYVVQDIEEVLDHFIHRKKLDFGKRFSYDPNIYRLKREDEKMLQVLQDIVQIMQSTSPGRGRASRNELYIPPEMVQSLIRQMLKLDLDFLNYPIR